MQRTLYEKHERAHSAPNDVRIKFKGGGEKLHFYYIALLQPQHLAGKRETGGAMGDQNHGALRQGVFAFCNEGLFTLWIEHGSGFVQQQNRRIFEQCAGKCNALAAGQPDALIANQGVVPLRQANNEIVRLGGLRYGNNRLRICVGAAIGNIVAHATVE